MRDKIILHNHQLGGDEGPATKPSDADDILGLVISAYRSGMAIKNTQGVSRRLRHAYEYLTSDRVDRLVMDAIEDADSDDDCDSCGEFSINLDFIRLQHEAALSLLYDALKSRGEDYSSIEPTPKPDVSEASAKLVAENAFNSLMRELVGAVPQEDDDALLAYLVPMMEDIAGTENGLDRLEELATRQRQIENAKTVAIARRKAENAKTHIDDKLVESNFDKELRALQSHMLWYDYGVWYAPYKKTVDTTSMTDDGYLKEDHKEVWSMHTVHPLNHFYSETTTYHEMGDFEGDVVYLTQNDLRDLKSLGGESDAIDYTIENFNNIIQPDYLDKLHIYGDPELQTAIPVLRIFIKLGDEQVDALFHGEKKERKRKKKHKSVHMVEIIATEENILYKKLYPRWKEFSPYRKMSFNMADPDNMSAGRGLYSLCRTAQELIDNALVGLFDNMGDLKRNIIEANADKLVAAEELRDDLRADQPIVETKASSEYAAYGGNDRALHLMTLPDNIGTFSNALAEGIALMERIGLSAFTLGQANLTNVRSTGQTAIIQANGNRRFAKVLTDQEELIESPLIEYIWIDECMTTKDRTMIVDSTVRAKSYSSFLQKQERADEVGLFMQNMVGLINAKQNVPPNFAPFMDNLIAQYASLHGYDSSQLNIEEPTEIGQAVAAQDFVAEPLDGLDGRNNVPPDIADVI